ncbi:5675_t:CDS:2 [Gigaspora margarita]|uniref:5675_t:CDS:1 n=1 Tax=Gigaspora margarita TaxID=4874 RepID=A0ABN7VLD9_GIGMA|nr:5675_t:CDS:2 [Gigaspora margarita]
MLAIATKIIEKYNLSSEMSVADLSQYASEFLENLTDDRKRNQARRCLRDSFKFSDDQVGVLIPNQRDGKSKTINLVEGSCRIVVTKPQKVRKKRSSERKQNEFCKIDMDRVPQEAIGEMAHRLLRDKLSIRDIRAEAYALALSAKNANAGSSLLSRLRKELRNLGALPTIVEATKFSDFTEEANKIQKNNRKRAEANRIDYPDEFILESVKERLDAYDLKTSPNYWAFADVIVMLCIRPAELTTLHITDAGVTGYVKNQGNPGKPGVKWFNRFLKEYSLIPKYLRKLGAVYSAVVHKAENPGHIMTIAGECLRHSPDNHTSSVQNYIVVNYRKHGQKPEEARPFRLYDDGN